jgi:hypothetical protein
LRHEIRYDFEKKPIKNNYHLNIGGIIPPFPKVFSSQAGKRQVTSLEACGVVASERLASGEL